jgi:hypothetical protein
MDTSTELTDQELDMINGGSMMDVLRTTGRVIEATAKLGAAIILGVAAVVAAPYNTVNGGPA